MKKAEYERMIVDARNEVGILCLQKLGTSATYAVAVSRTVEANIHAACDSLNDLVEAAQTEGGAE